MATVLQRDIIDALRRLRSARISGDTHEAAVCEKRLNWLLEKVDIRRNLINKTQKSDYENAE